MNVFEKRNRWSWFQAPLFSKHPGKNALSAMITFRVWVLRYTIRPKCGINSFPQKEQKSLVLEPRLAIFP